MHQSRSDFRNKVVEAYSAAALRPDEIHAFPVGRRFAESLGYPSELLDTMPSACVEAFAGVSNVSITATMPIGATVLDLGCGAGLDSLIAARRVGIRGTVVGVDLSGPMLARARQSAKESGIHNIAFCQAGAEKLPLRDESVIIALVNGIFNLNPERTEIFRELGRVVCRGGTVYASELFLRCPLPLDQQQCETNWFA